MPIKDILLPLVGEPSAAAGDFQTRPDRLKADSQAQKRRSF
jgi:hypothetical protein